MAGSLSGSRDDTERRLNAVNPIARSASGNFLFPPFLHPRSSSLAHNFPTIVATLLSLSFKPPYLYSFFLLLLLLLFFFFFFFVASYITLLVPFTLSLSLSLSFLAGSFLLFSRFVRQAERSSLPTDWDQRICL